MLCVCTRGVVHVWVNLTYHLSDAAHFVFYLFGTGCLTGQELAHLAKLAG